MPPLPKLFWFTVTAGTLSAVLFDYTLLRIFEARSASMLVLIRTGTDTGDPQALQHLYHVITAALIIGPPLLFWFAYRLAPRIVKPSTSAITDAGR